MKKVIPKAYKKDIYSINYERLSSRGIKYLLFDMDNTLIPNNNVIPEERLIKLFEKLRKNFKIIILSNALPSKIKKFKKNIEIDDYFSLSCKPLTFKYKKVLKKYKIKRNKIACIGDQLFTDIKGANKMQIFSILVDPISNKESIFTKINRIKEKKAFNTYITKGGYYE